MYLMTLWIACSKLDYVLSKRVRMKRTMQFELFRIRILSTHMCVLHRRYTTNVASSKGSYSLERGLQQHMKLKNMETINSSSAWFSAMTLQV